MKRALFLGLGLLVLACGGGTSLPLDTGMTPIVAAGAVRLVPGPVGGTGSGVDFGRLGVGSVSIAYDLTTPADTPFAFDLMFRTAGNAGQARVSLAHALSAGATPSGGPTTLAQAGFVATGPGRGNRGVWMDATGDGFSRVSVRGAIHSEQVLAIQGSDGSEFGTALVRLRIGEPSAINRAAATGGDYPGIVEEVGLYSSDSWSFGLPTAALSGDRTSVVCYEGDRGDPTHHSRYEMRLQHDAATGQVTGGGSEESSPDSGNWRDHEVAALYNVLALVHGGTDAVTLKLSFDRGATFAQTETFRQGTEAWRPRLVQLAMAEDYSLAVFYWRSNRDGSSDLVLVEGRPSALDGGLSPTAYEFDPARVVYHDAEDVTPTLMGAEWSIGGDLVVGYAFTRFRTLPDRTWEAVTQNRCASRPWGGTFRDVLVEEDRVVGRDPSVALLGAGDTMHVFYAYEAEDGVRVRSSTDGGRSFAAPFTLGDPSAYMPTVFARSSGGPTVVDVIYLAFGFEGMELHVAHWDDWGVSEPAVWRLTSAVMRDAEGDCPFPEPGPPDGIAVPGTTLAPPACGWLVTQVAWLGYDAILDGDDIVVVYDEETVEGWLAFLGAPEFGGGDVAFDGAAGGADAFVPVDPPPLAPGMTEPVPVPDPAHRHQLRLLRMR